MYSTIYETSFLSYYPSISFGIRKIVFTVSRIVYENSAHGYLRKNLKIFSLMVSISNASFTYLRKPIWRYLSRPSCPFQKSSSNFKIAVFVTTHAAGSSLFNFPERERVRKNKRPFNEQIPVPFLIYHCYETQLSSIHFCSRTSKNEQKITKKSRERESERAREPCSLFCTTSVVRWVALFGIFETWNTRHNIRSVFRDEYCFRSEL